ncbi:ATP-binding protein [Paenibacillus sp. 1P07SE]|uniref:ATP-binding protein n=1 Tax=Paenibacillus sp. 1P07SE TaxID=3132209 RepID=UPI0039A4F1BE
MLEFPISYYEGNLIFAQDGKCWAYYDIPGFNYDFLSDDEKMLEFRRLESFFWQINSELHMLILPEFQSIHEKYEQYKETLSGAVMNAALDHIDDTVDVLQQRHGSEGTEYRFFIGVKLPDLEKANSDFFKEAKELLKEFFQFIHEKSGIEGPEILEEAIKRHMKSERRVYTKVSSRIHGQPIDEDVTQWLIRRNWYRGIGKAPVLQQWSPVYTVHYTEYEDGNVKVRRPVHRDIMKLTEGKVDESPGRSLIVRQSIDGEEWEGHMAFMTISNVPYDMTFPGDEWLYAIQGLEFPVEISIRTKTMDNRVAMTAVRNKQKELKDQDRHAQETDNDTSLNVMEGRAESQELEAHLQKTRMPLILSSIVLCLAASDEDELRRRCDIIKDTYEDMGIHVEQPYGDQFLLFNEFLPGAKRYVPDYEHYMEPGTMAGGMFGATKQIGDGQGFYIGHTGILNQPVYIAPNLAAQGVRGSKTNALSACFIGSLGGGKSYNANLITYNAVLSGAKALVIDPKGERGNWAHDLKALEGNINIVSLSSDSVHTGKLDPYSIFPDSPKDAEALALNILTYFTGVAMNDSERFPRLAKVVRQVSEECKFPSMTDAVNRLIKGDLESSRLGEHMMSFKELSFASLLFGDGDPSNSFKFETAMNVLMTHDLELPTPETDPKEYTLNEMLSVGMMLPIGSFALKYIHGDRGQFKIVEMDEAWSMLNTSQGKSVTSRLIREGRAMNSGIYLISQNANDLLDEKIKNNIGMKFAFRSTDPDEISNVLKLFNLRDTEYNRTIISELENGHCLMQDIYGRSGVIKFDPLFADLDKAFDTRPPQEKRSTEREKVFV